MIPFDPNDPVALGAAVFRHRRGQRPAPRSHVPAPLREIACLLLDIEPLAFISDALEIERATLRRWAAARLERGGAFDDTYDHGPYADTDHDAATTTLSTAAPTRAHFVPLPPTPPMLVPMVNAPTEPTRTASLSALTIERADGVRLHLDGPIEFATIAALIGTGSPR